MASWISLVLLSALAVSALSLPDERAYKIPDVGGGRRSQYYVLHGDGTYKYGYDTGEGAYESARLKQAGRQVGKFGYRDPEGNAVNLQYQAGEGGFVARGDHLPATHPDFNAAHAAARARPAFVDPLADSGTDASYGFQFAEDGLARSEQSDADGNVRGSYTYTDEEGRTRSYSYTAGRDTGFVIEGDDLPQAPEAPGSTPAATRLSASAGRFSASRTTGATSTGTASTAFRKSPTASFRPARPSSTSSTTGRFSTQYRTPTTSHTSTFPRTPSVPSTISFPGTHSTTRGSTLTRTQYTSPTFPSTRQQTGSFEPANTRSQLTSDGGYSFAYETSSHSRAESGDRDNNVAGEFDFIAEDDGQRRAIEYEAGSATGFIAEGAHIPVGPEVPGAPSGQPTGRIVPVQEVPFVDPLADSTADASYNFGFESEQYSRSEVADADGNVQGTYTVVDDDGTRRTYRFRAGEGVGFETEEVSTSRGSPPARPASASFASTFHSSSAATAAAAAASSASSGATSTTTYTAPTRFRPTSTVHQTHTSAARRPTSTSAFTKSTAFKSSVPSTSPLKTTFSSTSRHEVFPGFQLHQYEASKDANKYGYVLKFDK